MESINSGIDVGKLDVTCIIMVDLIFLIVSEAGCLRDFVSLYGLLCIMNG